MTPSRDDILKAISTVTDSRRSHETWIIWYDRNPLEEANHSETCGDKQWHSDCITGYDQVLGVLSGFLDIN